ncbi:MAG: 6-carboxytetrahydropterin synthase [Chloroflexi bacterium]|nr:6-carboxytetrahydropterin synthase [Chloroflexota bacterium]
MSDDPGAGLATHEVEVRGVRLRFAAAHMATIGAELEPLHGHNYAVGCRVEGDLTGDSWVIDFAALKRLCREACEELDHHFLLQARSPLLDLREEGGSWIVSYGERLYRFPAEEVAALPLENTTAELIARWLWERVRRGLREGGHEQIRRLAVEVEEMPGQSASYRRDLG